MSLGVNPLKHLPYHDTVPSKYVGFRCLFLLVHSEFLPYLSLISEVFVHYTDGRGETNMVGNRTVKSVTKWKDQTLVLAMPSKSKIAGDTVEIRETIKLQFAEDGDRLVEVTQVSGSSSGGVLIPPGPRTLIFARSATPIHE